MCLASVVVRLVGIVVVTCMMDVGSLGMVELVVKTSIVEKSMAMIYIFCY